MTSFHPVLTVKLTDGEELTLEPHDLGNDLEDVIPILEEGRCDAWYWTTLASEYWCNRGKIDIAEQVVDRGIAMFEADDRHDDLDIMRVMRANLLLARARSAPKIILSKPKQDLLMETKTREEWMSEANQCLNLVHPAMDDVVQMLTRGVLQLSNNKSLDEARRTFEGILAVQPNNVLALVGKARYLYVRGNIREAVKAFQRALALSPKMLPDPRIGIGLCAYKLGDHERAKRAWERSREVHPKLAAPQLLLALCYMNEARDHRRSQEVRGKLYQDGVAMLGQAFRLDQFCGSTATALSEHFTKRQTWDRAIKLAERAVQYGDLGSVVSDGHLRLARIAHLKGDYHESMEEYQEALELPGRSYVGFAGLGQTHILNNEIPAAIHNFENLLKEKPDLVEALLPLASLHAASRPGMNKDEQANEQKKARELFDRATRALNAKAEETDLGADKDVWIEIGKLWQAEDMEKTRNAYERAVFLAKERADTDGLDPKLLNALAVLKHLHGRPDDLAAADVLYTDALLLVKKMEDENAAGARDDGTTEVVKTTILYNLARCAEAVGDKARAKELYARLLEHHKEYVDAKIRLAMMFADEKRISEADALFKQALVSEGSNLNVRAAYTHFLVKTNNPAASQFIFDTLEMDRHDVYSRCAFATFYYQRSRESRDVTPEAIKKKKESFERSARYFDGALNHDPTCVTAAMGMAIIIAEDALGSLAGFNAPGVDEAAMRERNAADALSVFARLRESIHDASVYVNMAHCHFTLEQYDKAIENYEAALNRYYNGKNVSVLLHLCRSWYAKGQRENSPEAVRTALEYARKALEMSPNDISIEYNVALCQQKTVELLFGLPPPKRTLAELTTAIEQAHEAQKKLKTFVEETTRELSFNRDVADQRRRYGDNMLRRSEEHIEKQKEYEEEVKAKIEAARQMRADEQRKIQEAEEAKKAELQRQAAEIAEKRRLARAEAAQWAAAAKAESDEENERKAQRAAARGKGKRGQSDDDSEPRKKRKGGKVKNEDGDDEDALFTDEEKPKKLRTKRVLPEVDDDEEEVTGRRKKKIKSKATISDSDGEME